MVRRYLSQNILDDYEIDVFSINNIEKMLGGEIENIN